MTVQFNPEAITGPLAAAFLPALEQTAKDTAALAPTETGLLKRSIKAVVQGEMNGTVVAAAPYAKYVDQGTHAHTIKPIRKIALAGKGFGPVAIAQHPATEGKRFMEAGVATFRRNFVEQARARFGH